MKIFSIGFLLLENSLIGSIHLTKLRRIGASKAIMSKPFDLLKYKL